MTDRATEITVLEDHSSIISALNFEKSAEVNEQETNVPLVGSFIKVSTKVTFISKQPTTFAIIVRSTPIIKENLETVTTPNRD